MLKVEVETPSAIKRRVTVEVPREQVATEIERAYSDLRRRAQVPGFRPGRAPRAVLERQFGDRVRSEVFGKLIQDSYVEALRQEQIQAASQPEITTELAEPGSPLRFTATVEVYPQFEARDYSNLHLERPVTPITDEDVDRYLARLQESFAQLQPIEDRTTIASGDAALIDYEARLGDRVLGRAENRPCEVGHGDFPEAFEARLVGATVGETLDFPVTYPADDKNLEIAGKTVQFHVTIRSLAQKDVPPLDDDFAKDHGECDTLAELRTRIRGQLEAAASRQADEQLRSAAITTLVSKNDFELPESLVARQTEQMMVDVAERWRARRIWPKDEAAAFASLREELAPQARHQVKVALLLDAIAQQEHVEVGEKDLDAEIERAAAAAGEAADRVRALSARPEARHNLRERLLRQRVLDLVLQRATVTTVETARESVAGEVESR